MELNVGLLRYMESIFDYFSLNYLRIMKWFRYSFEEIYNDKCQSFNDRVTFVEQNGDTHELIKNILALSTHDLIFIFSYIYIYPWSLVLPLSCFAQYKLCYMN